MALSLRVFLVAFTLVSLAGCAPFLDPGQPDDTSVRTTITGRVVDEAGKSVQGALVRGHGASTTTNTNGVFVLQNVTVPSTRAVVTVTKSGYFTGARAAYPSDGKITTMMLTLQQATQTRTVSSASGGKVTVGTASIDLPAGGYVDDEGKTYSGTVSVAARYLDPNSANFYDSFSGDMAALRADGSSTELVSYGVLRVLLTGTQGQPLNLAKGATALLMYPAAGAADAEIPLWHFDLTRGIWVEEGKATLSGGVYTGTVTHFTDWNLDKPNAARAFIEGRVTCGENLPLAGIVVDIGQVSVVTDQDGMYRRRVPADFGFDVEVKASRNEGISCSPVTVSPIAENQTKRQDLVVSPCPTLLEAQFVDCSDAPIGGVLQVITPTGVKIAGSTSGKVRVTVPAGVALTLEGYSTDGRTIASTPVAPISAGALFDAGSLKACSGVETKYTEFILPNNESARYACLNADGSRVAIVTQTTVFVFDASTGTQLWSAALQGTQQYATSIKFVNGDQSVAMSTNLATNLYDAANGQTTSTVTARGRHHVSPDGSTVYVMPDTTTDCHIDAYNAVTGAKRRTVAVSAQNKGPQFMGLQGSTNAVIQDYSSRTITTIDLTSGAVIRTFTGVGDTSGTSSLGEVSMLSPSGKVVVIVAGRGTSGGSQTNFVDLISGSLISSITSGASVLAISFADDEYVGRAYTAGAPVTLTTLKTQQLQRLLPVGTAANDYPSGFSFSADGSRLVGMSSGGNQGAPNGGGSKVRVYQLR